MVPREQEDRHNPPAWHIQQWVDVYLVRGRDVVDEARWAVHKGNSYEEVVRLTISLGNDTDTTACLAGGIAGIKYGVQGIPLRWRQALRGGEIVRPLVEGLLAHVEGAG